jgi:hypothetical protein
VRKAGKRVRKKYEVVRSRLISGARARPAARPSARGRCRFEGPGGVACVVRTWRCSKDCEEVFVCGKDLDVWSVVRTWMCGVW